MAISARESFEGRVTVTLDQRFSFDQEVTIAPWSEGKVMVPVSAGGPGLHLCEVKLPPDALDYDNHFRLTLPVQEKEEVLIVTDGPSDSRSGAFFLRTALNPFENEGGSLLPRSNRLQRVDSEPARRGAQGVLHAAEPAQCAGWRGGGQVPVRGRGGGVFSGRPGGRRRTWRNWRGRLVRARCRCACPSGGAPRTS